MGQIELYLYVASIWLLPVVIAITLHEAAHGWMANRLGDDTAQRLGRVTFNPIKHVDPFGTIVLPALLVLLRAPFIFGWAKPVPVAFSRLDNPKRDMIYVAIAGPAINIALAFAFSIGLMVLLPDVRTMEGRQFFGAMVQWYPSQSAPILVWLLQNFYNALQINIILACFNMLPIPPLDGGRVLTGLLPKPLAYRFAGLERYGIFILLGLLILVPLISERLGTPINPLAIVLMPVVNWFHSFFQLIYLP